MEMSNGAVARVLFWSTVVVLGFLQAWAARMDMGVDNIPYLDMGDYIFAGHWSMAVNGSWNPLYPCLLGFTLHVLHPSAYWQYPAVHLLLFLIFLFAATCFDFFLQQLICFRQEAEGEPAVPGWVYPAIGYLLFLWSSLSLVRVSETNPDMLVAAFFYLACGFLLLIRRGRGGRWIYSGLGVVLGLGYLTKAAMFPIALVCLAVVWASKVRSKRRAYDFVLALILFIATAAPFIAALSASRGKLTFSESGIYNYLTNVNGIRGSHWQGVPGQRLLHPTVVIFDQPEAFMFAGLPGGSYPVWYDPSYWYEGAKPRFSLRETLQAFYSNLAYLVVRLLSAFNGCLVASLFLLFCVSGCDQLASGIAKYWFLLLPSSAGVAMYLAVHAEARYVGGLVVVALLSLFLGVPTAGKPATRRFLPGTAILLALMFICPIGPGAIPKNSPAIFDFLKPLDAKPNPSAAVASGLLATGLRPGDRIASLEYSLCAIRLAMCEGAATWARLGGFRIVAEAYYWPENPATRLNNFWDLDPGTQQKLLRALGRSGARVVVSRQIPRGAEASSWEQIGRTPYYFRWLAAHSNPDSVRTPGPLVVCSVNPRYFCDPTGNVVYLAGDHTWADVQDLGARQAPHTGAFDFAGYLKFLGLHGYTWLRLWSWMYSQEPPCCNNSWNTFVGPLWPWVRTGPGLGNDGQSKTDLATLDSNYFKRLRARVVQAGQNGLYVSVMLFSDVGGPDSAIDGDPFVSGNNVNGVNCPAPCPVTLPLNSTVWSYEQAYIHTVVDTVHDLPNVMYEIANEPPTSSASWVTQVMNEIRIYESATYGSQHPVGINYGNGVADSNVYNTDADFVSPSTKLPRAATGQCPVPSGNSGRMNRGSNRCKAVINDSDHSYYFTSMQSDGTGGQTAWVWENFTLGNGVAFMDPYTFLWPGRNNCARTPDNRDTGLCAPNRLDGQWSQIRSAIADVAAYGKKIDLRTMTPQGSLSTSGFCLAAPGSQYLVFSTSNSFTLRTVAGTYTFEWFNPSTHNAVQTGSVTVRSKEAFTAPFSGDSVLWLHK